MKKPLYLLLIGFQLISLSAIHAQTRADILSRNGRWFTVDRGFAHGVSTVMKGVVKMDVIEGGKRYDITLGFFSVKKSMTGLRLYL